MESRPPQEPSRRPTTNGRKPNGAGTSPTPPWILVFLIALVALIAYLILNQRTETSVTYSPWFLEQVAGDNIESLVLDDLLVKGKLRKETAYHSGEQGAPAVKVLKFTTAFLAKEQIKPVIDELTNRKFSSGNEKGKEKKAETPRIEGTPTQGASGLVWFRPLASSS
jgi:cell division protease FtsH